MSAWLRSESSTCSSGSGPVAGDEVAEDRVLGLADRLIEARGGARRGAHFDRLLEWQGRLLGDLLERRLASELRPERPLGAVHLLQPLDDVDGHADRAGLVGERARNGLPDPPRRVRRELEAAAPVELLDGADQPERALLDQVEERQPLVPVVLRDRDDQAEVGLDHVLLRAHVAALDLLRELDLLRAVSSACRPASRRKSCSASVVVSWATSRGGRRRRLLGRRLVDDDLDPAAVELAVERVLLEGVQLVRLDDVGELGRLQRAGLLGSLQQLLELVVRSRCSMSTVVMEAKYTYPGASRCQTTQPGSGCACSSTARSSPTRSMIACAPSISAARERAVVLD